MKVSLAMNAGTSSRPDGPNTSKARSRRKLRNGHLTKSYEKTTKHQESSRLSSRLSTLPTRTLQYRWFEPTSARVRSGRADSDFLRSSTPVRRRPQPQWHFRKWCIRLQLSHWARMDGHTVYKDGHSWGCDHDSVAAGPAFFTSLVSYPHFNVNLQNTSSCISDRRIGSHVSGTDQSSSRRPAVQPQNVMTKFTCRWKNIKPLAYSHLRVHGQQPSHSRCPTGTRPGRACHPACRMRSGSSRYRTAPQRRRSRSCSCMRIQSQGHHGQQLS